MSNGKHRTPGLSEFIPAKTNMFPFSRKEYESNINRLFDDVYAKASISKYRAAGFSLVSFSVSGFISFATTTYNPILGLDADMVHKLFLLLYIVIAFIGGALVLFSHASSIKNFPKDKYRIIEFHMNYAFDEKRPPSDLS